MNARSHPPSPRLRPRHKSGFTLIEMMITLIVFLLLCGAVFGLMTSMLQGASVLQDDSDRRDRITALNAYIRSELGSMTSHSTLFSYLRGDGDGLNQNGIIFGTPTSATAIDSKIQSNGLYTLRVAKFIVDPSSLTVQDARTTLQQSVSTDDPTLSWVTLMIDLKTIDWKFQDPNITDWVEQWTAATNPNLIEFSLQSGADPQPLAMDFWVPKLDTINIRIAAPAGGTNKTPTNPTRPGQPTKPPLP